MIILHTSDFHFNKPWYDWLLSSAPHHDLLVMSGDLLDLSKATPARQQQNWISRWVREYPRPLCLCSGNHDLEWDSESERWHPAHWMRDLEGPGVWIDGQCPTIGDLRILNIGCTTRPKGARAQAWVVHAPPTGTAVARRSNGRDGGDPELVGRIARFRPQIVFAGHVHDPVRWHDERDGTLHLNPGCTPTAPLPNHILLDTEQISCLRVTASSTEQGPSIPSPEIEICAAETSAA